MSVVALNEDKPVEPNQEAQTSYFQTKSKAKKLNPNDTCVSSGEELDEDAGLPTYDEAVKQETKQKSKMKQKAKHQQSNDTSDDTQQRSSNHATSNSNSNSNRRSSNAMRISMV